MELNLWVLTQYIKQFRYTFLYDCTAEHVIWKVILHEKFSFPYVNNVTDWEHSELSFTIVHATTFDFTWNIGLKQLSMTNCVCVKHCSWLSFHFWFILDRYYICYIYFGRILITSVGICACAWGHARASRTCTPDRQLRRKGKQCVEWRKWSYDSEAAAAAWAHAIAVVSRDIDKAWGDCMGVVGGPAVDAVQGKQVVADNTVNCSALHWTTTQIALFDAAARPTGDATPNDHPASSAVIACVWRLYTCCMLGGWR